MNNTNSTPSFDTKEIKKKIINYASGFAIDKINTFIEKKNKPSTNNNFIAMDQQQIQQNQKEKQIETHSQMQSKNKYGYIEEDDKLLEVLVTSSNDLDVQKNQMHERQSEMLITKNKNKNEKRNHKKKNEYFSQTQRISSSDDNDDYSTADEQFGDSNDNDNNVDPDDDSIDTKSHTNIRNYDEKIIKKRKQSVLDEPSKINNTNGNEKTTSTLSTQDGKEEKNIVLNNTALNTGASAGHAHSSSSSTDYSGYIQKKSLAQGMMDLALLSANTNQLRYILEYKDQHPYFATSFSLVIASLFLQIAVGLALIWNTKFNVKKRDEMKEADRVNNFGVVCIFLVTLINVFLSTFSGAPNAKSPTSIEAVTSSDVGSNAITSTVSAIITLVTTEPTTPTTNVQFINDETVLYN